MPLKERHPNALLGLAARVGSADMISFMEYDGGVRLREQGAVGWRELPAELNTTGVCGNLGYTEGEEARWQRWGCDHAVFDTKRNRFVPGTWVPHNIELYRIQLATFAEVGFQFHPEDVRNYIQWMGYDNLHYSISERWRAWATERGCYFAGQGDPEDQTVYRNATQALYKARRWAEDTYLRGAHMGPKWVRGKLPVGWRIEDDGHPQGIWNRLVTIAGDEGGVIFYKAYEHCYMRLGKEWYFAR